MRRRERQEKSGGGASGGATGKGSGYNHLPLPRQGGRRLLYIESSGEERRGDRYMYVCESDETVAPRATKG